MKNVHFAIPEIYGETLSYYELLRKLVNKTNELIENYNTVPEQIAEAVANLDASQLFSEVLNQLIHSIATDNTKSANAVKVYKKHDLLYATFNNTVNLYESLIDFTTGTETELIVGSNIREVNISELFIELRKLIDINKNNIEAVTHVANENSAEIETIHGDITAVENKNTEQDNEIATIHSDITAVENKNTEQDNEITTIHGDITAVENKNTEQDNALSTLRTMISSPYNFKGDVASISALPASGEVNDTYYVQDVKYKVTWTGSAWVQSSLSEDDYQNELVEIKDVLSEIDSRITWVENLCNSHTSTYGYYYPFNNSGYTNMSGNGLEAAGYRTYRPIKVLKGVEYSVSNSFANPFSGFCDENGKVICKYEAISSTNTFIPTQDCYLYATGTGTYESLMVIRGNELPSHYLPYGVKVNIKILGTDYSSLFVPHFIVGADEQIKTLKEGIEKATQFKNAVLYVKNGVYDIAQEFGSALDTYDGVGLILKNGVKIHFETGVKIIFDYNGTNENIYRNFSVFNSGVYGFELLGNCEIVARNCRYCIHDERGNSTDYYRNVYNGIKMSLNNKENPYWKNPQVIGCGLGSNGDILIEDCDFGCWITFHNNNGTTKGKSRVVIKNNYVREGSVTVSSMGESTEITQFIICGNRFTQDVNNLDTETKNINIEVLEFNNQIG